MKSVVSLSLLVFTVCSLGFLASGCCEVEVATERGFLEGSLVPAAEVASLPAGEPLDVFAKRIGGSRAAPLRIQSRKRLPGGKWADWDQPEPMRECVLLSPMALLGFDEKDDERYTHTFENVNETFQYKIRNVRVGGGPFTIDVRNKRYDDGYEHALEFWKGELQACRVVIALVNGYPTSSKTYESDRREFLRGFMAAYADVNHSELGQRWADVLRRSTQGGVYEEAFQQGRRHVRGQVTNAHIGDVICRSVGLSMSVTLGWKAGYIEGFVQGKFDLELNDRERLYQEAETMYRMLRAAEGC